MGTDLANHMKLPLAKALTHVDLDRIDVEKGVAGEPVTIHSSDGSSYRVEGKLERLARAAHQLALEGHAPDDLESGRLAVVLQRFVDGARKAAGEDGGSPTEEANALTTIAEEVAEAITREFSIHLEEALEKRFSQRRSDLLRKACATMMR